MALLKDAQPILAKSPGKNGQVITLTQHGSDVMNAFTTLFGTLEESTRLGWGWLRFFRVPESDWQRFVTNGLASCGAHDLGKANNGFQEAMIRCGKQVIRHEHLSVLLLSQPNFDVWLKQHDAIDVDVVLAAVAGHHLKCSWRGEKSYPALGEPMPSTAEWVELYADHSGFVDSLKRLADVLDLPAPDFELPLLWSLYTEERGETLNDAREQLVERLHRSHSAVKIDLERHRLMMAVKSAVIVADTAGSGLVREQHSIAQWLHDCFSVPLLKAEDIEKHVWQPRVAEISQTTGEPFTETDFQTAARVMSNRSLLLAPCGSGKTLAAWRWIQARLAERPHRNVLFLYPTRATATEGFKDYVSHAPETDATLLSGTSAFDLEDMFSNPEDLRTQRDYLTDDRLYAIGYWNKRVFAATVDQFLGFMQQVYRSVCLLPVLVDSVVVFDEVHSFDPSLFNALKRFLHAFDIPVLCMTASLPTGRRQVLQELGLELHPQEPSRFSDLIDHAELPRYNVKHLQDREAAIQTVKEALANYKRVLWVVNTVDCCQELAQQFDALCYHSRFTLKHRKQRHEEVVASFKGERKDSPVMAVTTQVCEMSLDLDADVLITEAAPIPALIQRMGRCNRLAKESNPSLGQVFVYFPESKTPYDDEDLHRVAEFVSAIDGGKISQADLDKLLEDLTADLAREPERIAAFIDDGPWSIGGRERLREGDDYSVPAVLDTDVEDVLVARKRREPIDGWIVPAPKFLSQVDSRLGVFPQVAPTDHYHPRTGLHKHTISTESKQKWQIV